MAGIIDRIRRFFGGKKPSPPKVTGGHRGIAARDLKKPDLTSYAGRVARRGRDDDVPVDEATAFVYEAHPLFVNSSNVVMAQYHIEAQKMMVEFKGGKSYMYSNISPAEATSFVQAQSKGGWVWDHLRVRGTRNGHRKPYTPI